MMKGVECAFGAMDNLAVLNSSIGEGVASLMLIF